MAHQLVFSFPNETIMRSVIQFDGIKFWVDQDIIHCNLDSVFFSKYEKANIEEIFYNAIPILSKGTYMPFLINIENLERPCALKIFNIISKSAQIKRLVLSRIFLVNSIELKVILSLNNIIVKQVVPNKIFRGYDAAVNFCKNDYMIFNEVSEHRFS